MTQLTYIPPRRLRLRLKPGGSARGSVDGAWWPRSRSLPTELPAIVHGLLVRSPHLERIAYRFLDWEPGVPDRLDVDGLHLHLDGYAMQTPGTIQFVGSTGVLVLAIIPPDSADEPAHHAMMAAAGRENTQSASELAAAVSIGSLGLDELTSAEGAWDSEGGHLEEGRHGRAPRTAWF